MLQEIVLFSSLLIICIIVFIVYNNTIKHITSLRYKLNRVKEKESELNFKISKLEYDLSTTKNANRLLQVACNRKQTKIDELVTRLKHAKDG